MITRNQTGLLILAAAMLVVAATRCLAADNSKPDESADTMTHSQQNKYGVWIDVAEGEPISFGQMIEQMSKLDVVYLGERHTIDRHHEIQTQIIDALGTRRKIVVCFEQLERFTQESLDEYTTGEITFAQLAEKTDWASRWSNYEDYRPLLETARRHNGKFVAMNARSETIRQIARKGMDSLSQAQRAELPEKIVAGDPKYARHLRSVMRVMPRATPEHLDAMILAQIVRDETMSESVARFLKSPAGEGYMAIVICGSGHVNYGFGTAARLRRRMGQLKDKIVVMSNSGELEMPKSMAAMMKKMPAVTETPEPQTPDKRIADYLHVVIDISESKTPDK